MVFQFAAGFGMLLRSEVGREPFTDRLEAAPPLD
jgi:hypothetical protein